MNNKVAKKIRKYYRSAAKVQGIRDINEWMEIQKRKVNLWRNLFYVSIVIMVITLSIEWFI
jgi:hypothetical protein